MEVRPFAHGLGYGLAFCQIMEVNNPCCVGGDPVRISVLIDGWSTVMAHSMIFLVSLALGIVMPSSTTAAEPAVVEQAADQSVETALADARRALEIAKLEHRLYVQVDYPRERRCLDSRIKIISAEIDALKDRVREYEKYHRSRYSKPFLTSLQECRLALLDAELRLKDARAEQSALYRFHSDRTRLFELKEEAARARVVTLDKIRYGS